MKLQVTAYPEPEMELHSLPLWVRKQRLENIIRHAKPFLWPELEKRSKFQ